MMPICIGLFRLLETWNKAGLVSYYDKVFVLNNCGLTDFNSGVSGKVYCARTACEIAIEDLLLLVMCWKPSTAEKVHPGYKGIGMHFEGDPFPRRPRVLSVGNAASSN